MDNNSTFTPALHTLFLQRWRLSLVVQATSLNQQLLDEERDQLLSEVQERMTLSGQLEPVLVENDNAAGHLWDMSAGELEARRLSADRSLRRLSKPTTRAHAAR